MSDKPRFASPPRSHSVGCAEDAQILLTKQPPPTPAAPTLSETAPRSSIQPIKPLGEQIIIRTLPPQSIGSIIIPDSAKGITQKGSKGDMDAVHFVEAEVIAVGPGKRLKKGDAKLLEDTWATLTTLFIAGGCTPNIGFPQMKALKERYEHQNGRIEPLVKPGDRILYHPAVQKFDRDITDVMQNGNEPSEVKYFIIREESVLAVIER